MRRILIPILLSVVVRPVAGQAVSFGSADRLAEQLQQNRWQRDRILHAMGGLALIGAQWRASGNVTFEWIGQPLTARLSGSVRWGPLGTYGPDWDEPYDLLRLLEFARYTPPTGVPVHARIGILNQMRLGTGHVVNFHESYVAWDRRTVGAEFMWSGRVVEVAGFTDDVLASGVLGGRLAVRPAPGAEGLALSSLRVGVNYATDRRSPLEAWNLDAQFDLFSSGDISFAPHASYAWYTGFGEGLALGADLYGDEFIDLFSFRLRLAVFYNGKRFIPGYVSSFYPVSNLEARIVRSGADLDNILPDDLVGVPLAKGRGGNDLLTEFRLTIIPYLSFWYYHRHHLGSQRLSEFHLRLFWRSGDAFRIEVGMDRIGKGGLFSYFRSVDDQSALVFGSDYRIAGPLHVYVHARYGYERIDDEGGAPRYLVQRRFEPHLGMRIRL